MKVKCKTACFAIATVMITYVVKTGLLYVLSFFHNKSSIALENGKTEMFEAPWRESIPSSERCPKLEDRSDWTFKCKYVCPVMNTNFILSLPRRLQFVPVCPPSGGGYLRWEVTSMNNIPVLEFRDPCVESFIHKNCSGLLPVPNIVHYVWYGLHHMKFEHFLSVYSTYTIQTPCLIFIHGDFLPTGLYWRMILRLVPNIIFLQQTPPVSISGKAIHFIEHKSDITRIAVLIEYGGIYLDFDAIQLAPLNPLRQYAFTMGTESDNALFSGILLAERNTSFLLLWLKGYDVYYPNRWGYNALNVPSNLSREHPELIHIERNRLVNPTYENRRQIFQENFNWTDNYTIHLYIRRFKFPFDIVSFRTMNNTLGAVARYVLFGHKEMCIF